jgi:adenylosuccinate lyase
MEGEGTSFAGALAEEPEILERLGKQLAALGLLPDDGGVLAFFERPEAYCGLAAKKAKALAAAYQSKMRSEE